MKHYRSTHGAAKLWHVVREETHTELRSGTISSYLALCRRRRSSWHTEVVDKLPPGGKLCPDCAKALVGARTVGQWQATIDKWASKTFDHTALGIWKHLVREVVELGEALDISHGEMQATCDRALRRYSEKHRTTATEEADCIILLLALAGYQGDDLEGALAAKHEINLEREWGEPDAEGIREHM